MKKVILIIFAIIFLNLNGLYAVKVGSTIYYGKRVATINEKPFFPIGVTYHFYLHKDTWDSDLKLMKELGVNSIRIDAGWREFEKEDNKFDFSLYDKFLKVVDKYKLYIIISMQYCSTGDLVPQWFVRKFRDIQWQCMDYKNRKFGTFPSPSNEHYLKYYKRYVKALASHLKKNNYVIAYQMYNEPHFFENGPVADYNPDAIDKYRIWLKKRYKGDINKLNKFWKTSYKSFSEISPDRKKIGNWWDNKINKGRWEDWREFNYYAWARFEDEVIKAMKSVDKNKLSLATDMAWWMWGQGALSAAAPLNFKHSDIAGFDIYPGGIEEKDVPASISMMINTLYNYNKIVWMTEINDKKGNPTKKSLFEYIKLAAEEYATGVFYFEWSDIGAGRDGGRYGLLNALGDKRKQFDYFKQAVEWLKKNVNRLLKKNPRKPDFYVLWSRTLITQTYKDIDYSYSIRGVYRLLWENNYNSFVIRDIDLQNIIESGEYDFSVPIIVPQFIFIKENTIKLLHKILNNGGAVFIDVPFSENIMTSEGFKRDSKIYEKLLGFKLDKISKQNKKDLKITKDFYELKQGDIIKSHKHRAELVAINKNYKVLGTWENGANGIIYGNPIGKGKIMVAGTMVNSGCFWGIDDEQFISYQKILRSFYRWVKKEKNQISRTKYNGKGKEEVEINEKYLKGIIDNFDEGVSQWGKEKNIKLNIDNKVVKQGKYSMKVEYSDDGSGSWIWIRIHAIEEWDKYNYIAFFVKAEGDVSGKFEFTFYKETSKEKKILRDMGNIPEKWKLIIYKLPINAKELGNISFQFFGSGKVWIDNLCLIKDPFSLEGLKKDNLEYQLDGFELGISGWGKWAMGEINLKQEDDDAIEKKYAMSVEYDDNDDLGGAWLWKRFGSGTVTLYKTVSFWLKDASPAGLIDENAIFEIGYYGGKKIRISLGDIPDKWTKYTFELKDTENIEKIAFSFHGKGKVLVDDIKFKGAIGSSFFDTTKIIIFSLMSTFAGLFFLIF